MEHATNDPSLTGPHASPAEQRELQRPHRIMIVAGEASGDLHGSDLAREIRARDPSCELFGIAGAQMRAAGVTAATRIEDIHGLGLTELVSTIGLSLRTLRNLRRVI